MKKMTLSSQGSFLNSFFFAHSIANTESYVLPCRGQSLVYRFYLQFIYMFKLLNTPVRSPQ